MPPIFHDPLDTEEAVLDRTEELAAHRSMNFDRATPELTFQVAELANHYGATNLPPGAIVSMAESGIRPGDPVADQLATRAASKANEQGGIFSAISGSIESATGQVLRALKGTTRTAFTIAEGLMQELVLRPFRAGVAAAEGTAVEGFQNAPSAAGVPVGLLPGAFVGPLIGNSQFRQRFGQAHAQAGESALVRAFHQFREGGIGNIDLGSGFFPGGSAQEHFHATNTLTHDDQPISPGRFYGGQVFEPGTVPYNLTSGTIDAAVQVALDPAALATGGAAKVRNAQRVFQLPGRARDFRWQDIRNTFGVVAGHRRDVDVPFYVDRFLNQERAGQRLKQFIADTDDTELIWETLGRHRDRRLISRLRDEQDPVLVGDILSEALGLQIRRRPSTTRAQGRLLPNRLRQANLPVLNRSISDLRTLDEIPGRYLNIENPDETVETFVQYLKNANLDPATRKNLVSQYMDLQPGDFEGAFGMMRETMENIDGQIASVSGANHHLAGKITRLFDGWAEEFRAYFVDEIGDHVPVIGGRRMTRVNGEEVELPIAVPHLTTELLDRAIPLPDFREIRRATSRAGRYLDKIPGTRPTVGFFDRFMRNWKALQLLRGAWTIRVIGEEQVRMAGAGLDSPFRHPADWLGWVLAERGDRLQSLLRRLPGVDEDQAAALAARGQQTVDQARTGGEDVLGDLMSHAREHQTAMSSRAAGWLGDMPERAIYNDYVRYTRASNPARGVAVDDDQFTRMWGHELAQLWNDDIASRLARRNEFTWADARTGEEFVGVDAVKEWFWRSEEGHAIRQRFARSAGRDSDKWALVDDNVARRVGRRYQPDATPQTIQAEGLSLDVDTPWTSARQASDYYIDTVWDRIQVKTGRNPELIDAIATGQLDGINLRSLGSARTRRVSRALQSRLDSAPATIKGPRLVNGDRGGRVDRMVDTMFDALMGTPTDTLSRSPAFRQFYWQRIDELMPRVTDQVGGRVAAQARRSNVTLRNTAATSDDVIIDSLEDLDTIAKQHALDSTRELLYDMDRRGQFFDIARNIFPFGEAWKEVISTWRRLLIERPQNLRRFQQVVESGRGDDEGSGFFYTDPQTGEEMFNYPLIGEAMSNLLNAFPGSGTGNRAGLTARGQLQSLNLVAGSLLPGVGPGAAVAASAILSDHPDVDWLREVVLPFGEVDVRGDVGGEVLGQLLPAWAQKMVTGLFGDDRNQRLFANTRMSVVQGLMNSGDYAPHEIQEAVRDSAGSARFLYLLRGMAQFFLPTGPQVQHDLQGDDGRWHGAQVLAQEFRKMADEEGDWDRATAKFVERFGVDPLLVSQSRTRTVAKRSFTEEGWEWERAHRDRESVAPNTLGYFAPVGDPDNETFAYNAYLDAITEGASVPLTSEQQAALYNNQVGWAEYRRVKDHMERTSIPADTQRQILTQYRAGLRVLYPGFDSISRQVPGRPDTDILINELRRAAADPVLGSTAAGEGIARYLELRDHALSLADGTSLSGKRDRDLRVALRTIGEDLAKDNPDFAPVWLEVFTRELDDVEAVNPAALPSSQLDDETQGTTT